MAKSVTTRNLELAKVLDDTVKTVNTTYNSGVKGKFKIGKALCDAKPNAASASDEDKKAYSAIFDLLPFGEVVGDKFIRIYNTDYLRELASSKHVTNLPDGYNTLYALSVKEVATKPKVVDFLKEGFINGKFTVDGKTFPSTQVSAAKVTEIVKSVFSTEKPAKDKFDLKIAEIKINSDAFGVDLVKILKLEKLLQTFSVDDGEVKISEANLQKVRKSATKLSNDKLFADAEAQIALEISEAA